MLQLTGTVLLRHAGTQSIRPLHVIPLPKRWLVERTFAWLGRCRRLAKDFENLAVNALAFLRLGMICLMLRRLAKVSDHP